MKVKITDVTIDPAVAIREGTDEDTIQRYMDNFNELPPIIVYQTDHKYLLADGFHRWAAASRLGHADIEAEVRHGDYKEASEYAIYANLKHGKPLSREEYKNAVRRLNLLHPDWGRDRLSSAISRSDHFIRIVLQSDEVRRGTTVPLPDTIAEEIYRAPKEVWHDLADAAVQQDWTGEETAEKVREIKTNPERIDEILAIEQPTYRPQYSYSQDEYSETDEEVFDIRDIVYSMNGHFADIAMQRIGHNITREMLRPYATDIYTWRDAVTELINILEG